MLLILSYFQLSCCSVANVPNKDAEENFGNVESVQPACYLDADNKRANFLFTMGLDKQKTPILKFKNRKGRAG